MDTSKEYIMMCGKAEEIQKLWKHSKRSGGDWYFHTELNYAYSVTDYDQNDKHCIWLPRQDQLQKIIKIPNSVRMEHFFRWWKNNYFPTYEQDWLAFLMEKKYQKIWNGQDWTKVAK